VARTLLPKPSKARAAAARVALVDGAIGAVYALGAVPAVVFSFTVADGRISAIDLTADSVRIAAMDVEVVS
jgi:RNA polymerase sigma-70 factor (ECF subfamily)